MKKSTILITIVLLTACGTPQGLYDPDAATEDARPSEDASMLYTDAAVPVDAAPDVQTNSCGNSVLDPNEECDGLNLGGQDCTDYGFFSGNLTCNPDCTANVLLCEDEPEFCGDGIVQNNENCDYGDNPDCYADCSGYCGDGLIHDGTLYPDHGEECDGLSSCTPWCTITTCGDGWCSSAEQGAGNCIEDCGCGSAVECNGDCCEGLLPGTPGNCCSNGSCLVYMDYGLGGMQNCGTCGNTCAAGSQCIGGACQ